MAGATPIDCVRGNEQGKSPTHRLAAGLAGLVVAQQSTARLNHTALSR